MPKRIQIRRTPDWQWPPNAVFVGSRTKWANPFVMGGITKPYAPRTKENMMPIVELVDEFRRYAEKKYRENPSWVDPLIDKDLLCYCPPNKPCHADVLLELAKRRKEELAKQ
jgi:hypothetical protein